MENVFDVDCCRLLFLMSVSDHINELTNKVPNIPKLSKLYRSGPSCSKLTTSLVNDSLKFTSGDTQIR